MKIELIPSVDYVKEEELRGKTAIIIDVLRATSVITTAIHNGAESVLPVIEIEDALKLKGENVLLGGERKALRIEGFELSNSPLEYTKEKVYSKQIVLSTTNGTKAIHRAALAEKIIIGSMLNGKAVAEYVVEENKDLVIVCAGTYGKFSLDDFLCAGKIAYEINKLKTCQHDDFIAAAMMSYEDNKKDLLGCVSHAAHYKYLISINLQEDIKYCFTEDICKVVPMVEEEKGRVIIKTNI